MLVQGDLHIHQDDLGWSQAEHTAKVVESIRWDESYTAKLKAFYANHHYLNKPFAEDEKEKFEWDSSFIQLQMLEGQAEVPKKNNAEETSPPTPIIRGANSSTIQLSPLHVNLKNTHTTKRISIVILIPLKKDFVNFIFSFWEQARK